MLTPNFITRDDVLSIHADQIESFGGGTLGLRDEGLLDSALAQPKASFGGDLLSSPSLTGIDPGQRKIGSLSRHFSPFI